MWEDFLTSSDRAHPFESHFRKGSISVGFGNDFLTKKRIETLGSSVFLLNQVHGDTIVRCQSTPQRADGHWTDHKDQILVIKTADCLPVFLFDQRRLMGLHMGWRAFTHSLFEKALEHFDIKNGTHLVIGPHIQQKSFQVDQSTAQKILNYQGWTLAKALQAGIAKISFSQKDHFYINLEKILINKAQKAGIAEIRSLAIDTYTSPRHFSHRRNPYRIGTNYSYILKN